jgi:hypothetical protein
LGIIQGHFQMEQLQRPAYLLGSQSIWGLNTPGMYSRPCKCGQVYTWPTYTMVKGHHPSLYHPDKSVTAEHCIDLGHCILLQNIGILLIKSRHKDMSLGRPQTLSSAPVTWTRRMASVWAIQRSLFSSLWRSVENLPWWMHLVRAFTKLAPW